MKSLPFRLKIALLSGLVSGLVLVGFGAASLYLIYRQKIEAVDTEIRSLGSRHPGWITSRGNYQRLDGALEFIFGKEREDQIILLVKSAAGEMLYRSAGWPEEIDPYSFDSSLVDDPKTVAALATNQPATTFGGNGGTGRRGMGHGFGQGRGGPPLVAFTKAPRFQTVKTSQSTWRLGMLGTADTTLVIGLNYDIVRKELNRIRNALLGTLPVALFLVGWGGWVVAGRALRPIRKIAETAERVNARGLDQRIPLSNEDPEIDRVIGVLNRMMDRLEASFRQATRFSADASHELKTPLAVMQSELENAIQAVELGSHEQHVFISLLETTQRLKSITRSLLLLAQADAGRLKLALEPVDFSIMVQESVEDARVLAAESRLYFDVHVLPQLIVSADHTLLHTALFNLLVNAVRYSEPDGKVTVRLEEQAARVVLTICNTGPGIPVNEQTRIFERFHRVHGIGSHQVEGIGVGLSLAREVIHAHQGEVVLRESRPEWTCFELTLSRLDDNL